MKRAKSSPLNDYKRCYGINATKRVHGKMITRKLQIRDLDKVRRLVIENLSVKGHEITACLIHFAFDLPLRSLGLDTIFGSIAQTHDGKIVGVIIARRFPLAKMWVIGPVVVSRRYRGFGIGTGIMELALKLFQDKKAEAALISIDNSKRHSAARSLCQKFGFRYLKYIFNSSSQVYGYARMMTLKKSLYSETQESFSEEISSKTSQRIWYIMLKEF